MSFRLDDPEFLIYCNHLRDSSIDEMTKAANVFTAEAYAENPYGFSAGSFNGAGAGTSKVTAPNNSNLQGLFSTGGTLVMNIVANSDGEGDAGRIICKNSEYFLFVRAEADGKLKIRFGHYFSTTFGQWTSTATEIYIGKSTHIVLAYDGSAVTNNPISYINKKPVAFTEDSTPVGTPDISADDMLIGNNAASSATFDGLIWTVKAYKNMIMTHDEAIVSYNNSKIGM